MKSKRQLLAGTWPFRAHDSVRPPSARRPLIACLTSWCTLSQSPGDATWDNCTIAWPGTSSCATTARPPAGEPFEKRLSCADGDPCHRIADRPQSTEEFEACCPPVWYARGTSPGRKCYHSARRVTAHARDECRAPAPGVDEDYAGDRRVRWICFVVPSVMCRSSCRIQVHSPWVTILTGRFRNPRPARCGSGPCRIQGARRPR
jgi:hypothetical protein